jgi:2-hydroxychromene-2-carboxylate isomerase
MIEQQVSRIDYYVWLLSDWAYLGGVRFVQLAARHGLKINHIPMRMQDVYARSGGVLLANRSWQRHAGGGNRAIGRRQSRPRSRLT